MTGDAHEKATYTLTDRGFKHYEATAHLTIAQAEAVRDALGAAIANHYQQPFDV